MKFFRSADRLTKAQSIAASASYVGGQPADFRGGTGLRLGNYVLRGNIHRSERCEVVFAQSLSGDLGTLARQSLSSDTKPLGWRNLVALKIFHAQVLSSRIAVEADVLDRARHPNVVGLQDILDLPDGTRALVLEPLTGPTLSAYWERCGSLTPGQAVTLLAPLAGALGCLAEEGYVHGSLWPGRVRFDGRMRPVLTGFSTARKHAAALSDWSDFLGLIRSAGALSAEGEAPLRKLAEEAKEWLVSGNTGGKLEGAALAAWCEARLFRLADPEPLPVFSELMEAEDTESAFYASGSGGGVVSKKPVEKQAEGSPLAPQQQNSREGSALSRLVNALPPPLRKARWVFVGAFALIFLVALIVVPGPAEDISPAEQVTSAVETSAELKPAADVSPKVSPDAPAGQPLSAAALRLRETLQQCLREQDQGCSQVLEQLGEAQ